MAVAVVIPTFTYKNIFQNSATEECSCFLQWASCQMHRIAGCACAGNVENVFPATAGQQSRHASRHVRDARALMHVEIVNWRFPLKLVAGKTFPPFSAHAQPTILRIWQEVHSVCHEMSFYCYRGGWLNTRWASSLIIRLSVDCWIWCTLKCAHREDRSNKRRR